MSSEIMDIFWDLASLDDATRIAAAAKLIRHLVASPYENMEVDGEDRKMSEEVRYSVERLVKGLASPRLAARQGFSATLIELLANIEIVSRDLLPSTRR